MKIVNLCCTITVQRNAIMLNMKIKLGFYKIQVLNLCCHFNLSQFISNIYSFQYCYLLNSNLKNICFKRVEK